MRRRLRVPRYRSILEFVDFAILLFLFVLFLNSKPAVLLLLALADTLYRQKKFDYMVWPEILFIIFAFGFLLDEFTAAQEHGWTSAYSFRPAHRCIDTYLISQSTSRICGMDLI